MSRKGYMTEAEREYIRSKFGTLTNAQIARNLGRSRSVVSRIVSEEGLRARDAGERPEGERPPGEEPADTLSRLKELRDQLRDALKVAQPRETAALAREYRATLETIDRMEGDPTDEAASALDAIAGSIARRMSA